jgi:hypothetical protein
LGKTWAGADSLSKGQFGCVSRSNGKVWYNTQSAGRTHRKFSSVCEKEHLLVSAATPSADTAHPNELVNNDAAPAGDPRRLAESISFVAPFMV